MSESKESLIHQIVELENQIANTVDVSESDFMDRIKGLEDMSIPGLKKRLKVRLIALEGYLLCKRINQTNGGC